MQIRVPFAVVIAALIVAPTFAWGQQSASTTPTEQVTVEEFRNALVDYLSARGDGSGEAAWSGGFTSSDGPLVDDVLALDRESLELWIDALPDARRYVDLLRRATPNRGVVDPRIGRELPSTEPTADSRSFVPFVASAVEPPYPTDAGDYGWLLDRLQAFGLLPAVHADKIRCDAAEWAVRYKIWYDSLDALYIAEKACIPAGCDPTGIGCAAACGTYATVLALTQDHERELLLCDAHNANVDGAEIEAAFRNSYRGLKLTKHVHEDLDDHEDALSSHDTNLSTHDSNIDGDLSAHDTRLSSHDVNIDGDLAAHDVNIDGDLAAHDGRLVSHDTAMRNAVNGVQSTIDDEVELRSVHLQVLEVVNGQRYMVVATESGSPVDVTFEPVQVFASRSGAFQDVPGAGVSAVETGIYLVEMDAKTAKMGKVFRVRVEHDDTVDHFGQVVFHRDGLTVAGP